MAVFELETMCHLWEPHFQLGYPSGYPTFSQFQAYNIVKEHMLSILGVTNALTKAGTKYVNKLDPDHKLVLLVEF